MITDFLAFDISGQNYEKVITGKQDLISFPSHNQKLKEIYCKKLKSLTEKQFLTCLIQNLLP